MFYKKKAEPKKEKEDVPSTVQAVVKEVAEPTPEKPLQAAKASLEGSFKAMACFKDSDNNFVVRMLTLKDNTVLESKDIYRGNDKNHARERFKIEVVRNNIIA